MAKDGSASETVNLTQKKTGYTSSNADAKIGSFAVKTLFSDKVPTSVTVTVASDGTVSIK